MRKLLALALLASLAIAAPAQATCKAGRKKVEARHGSTRVISVWRPRGKYPRLRYYSQIGRRGKYFHLEDDYGECVNAGRRDSFVDPVYGGPILYRFSGGRLALASELGGEGGTESAKIRVFDPRRRKLLFQGDAANGQLTQSPYTAVALTLNADGSLAWTARDLDSKQEYRFAHDSAGTRQI